MVLGANAGSTILALLTTMFASRIGRRGPSATALLRSLMILVAMISLEFNVQNFVSLPDNVVLWHLVFNLAVGLLGLLIIHPLSHWTESILSTPEEDTEPNVNYKKLFVQENFLTVSISLTVAKKYLIKEIDAIRLLWLDIDTLLRSNPNPGSIMIMKNKKASTLKLSLIHI